MTTFNRRGFLGVLAASIGALALKPAECLWRPDEISLVPVQPNAIITLHQLTQEVARQLGNLHDVRPAPFSMIGEGPMTHQFSLELEHTPLEITEHGLDIERHVTPMVKTFKDYMEFARVRHVGALPITHLVSGAYPVNQACVYTMNGMTVRGVRLFDLREHRTRVRLDILTDSGQRPA